MFWSYITAKVKQAVLAGVAEGLAELEGAAEPAPVGPVVQDLLARLRQQALQPALPAPAPSTNGAAATGGDEAPAVKRARK